MIIGSVRCVKFTDPSHQLNFNNEVALVGIAAAAVIVNPLSMQITIDLSACKQEYEKARPSWRPLRKAHSVLFSFSSIATSYYSILVVESLRKRGEGGGSESA